eukprot:4254007-Amphidinium_carterae.1
MAGAFVLALLSYLAAVVIIVWQFPLKLQKGALVAAILQFVQHEEAQQNKNIVVLGNPRRELIY